MEVVMICEVPQKKTPLMGKANLNADYIDNYVQIALKNGFITEKNGIYAITDVGREFVKQIKVLEESVQFA